VTVEPLGLSRFNRDLTIPVSTRSSVTRSSIQSPHICSTQAQSCASFRIGAATPTPKPPSSTRVWSRDRALTKPGHCFLNLSRPFSLSSASIPRRKLFACGHRTVLHTSYSYGHFNLSSITLRWQERTSSESSYQPSVRLLLLSRRLRIAPAGHP
jgi:hypothetical protein